jgi:phospholipase/carboxylesterase
MFTDTIVDNPGPLGLKHLYSLDQDPEAPLVFLVHGRAGNMKLMLTFRRAAAEGTFSFVAPEAPIADPLGGFSWWLVDNGKTILENAEPASKTLQDFIDAFIKHHNLKPRALLALGFSQGGAVLTLLMQHSPKLFAGIGLLASFVVKKAEVPEEKLMTNILAAHGSQDETVLLAKAKEGVAYLQSLGAETNLVVDEVGHKVGTAGMRALKSWFLNFTPRSPVS